MATFTIINTRYFIESTGLAARRSVLSLLAAMTIIGTAAAQTTAPDLSITRSSTTAVYYNAYSVVTLTVKNQGTAPATALKLTYQPGQPTILPLVTGSDTITPIMAGHSGRGGGSYRVGWTITPTGTFNLAPGASTALKLYVIYPLGSINESWTVAPGTAAQLNKVSHTVAATISSSYPPVPSAPTGLAAREVGTADSLLVSWTAPASGGTAVTRSILTATPTVGTGTTVLSTTVTGPVTSASLVGVAPATTYSITVQSYDSSGLGPASAALTFATQASHIVPGVPVNVHDWWIGSGLAVAWTTPAPGDSPIDNYEVSIVGSDNNNVTSYASTATEDVVAVDSSQDSLTITVRAHNAAGWGPWSPALVQGGL